MAAKKKKNPKRRRSLGAVAHDPDKVRAAWERETRSRDGRRRLHPTLEVQRSSNEDASGPFVALFCPFGAPKPDTRRGPRRYDARSKYDARVARRGGNPQGCTVVYGKSPTDAIKRALRRSADAIK